MTDRHPNVFDELFDRARATGWHVEITERASKVRVMSGRTPIGIEDTRGSVNDAARRLIAKLGKRLAAA